MYFSKMNKSKYLKIEFLMDIKLLDRNKDTINLTVFFVVCPEFSRTINENE